MKTIDILSQLNINLNEDTNSLFDYLHDCENALTLDIFPKTICDNNKYKSVEVFYQKVLDKKLRLVDFEKVEQNFINFILDLWLYNDTYVNIINPEIVNNYYYKKNKNIFKKHVNFLLNILSSHDEFSLIEKKEALTLISILATREISPVVFYFRHSKIIVLLNGCIGLVYFGNSEYTNITKLIANNCSLYLYNDSTDCSMIEN